MVEGEALLGQRLIANDGDVPPPVRLPERAARQRAAQMITVAATIASDVGVRSACTCCRASRGNSGSERRIASATLSWVLSV
jgi:hypothetical protein